MSASGQPSPYLRQIEAALRGGDAAGAFALADRAVNEGADHPHLLVMAAHHRLYAGDASRALLLADRAAIQMPQSPDARNVQGLALIASGRAREALHTFGEALRNAPGTPILHMGKARAHEKLGEPDKVRAELDRVIAAQPDHHEALAWAALAATERGDTEAARALAARALALVPALHDAHLALAVADIADKNCDAAVARLEKLLNDATLSDLNRAFAQSVLGDARDGQKKYDAAFAAYAASKTMLRQTYAGEYAARESAAAMTARLADYFRGADANLWRARRSEKPARTHVFLLGFPRSGTTLLEQVLASHPHVETMEERDALQRTAHECTGNVPALDWLGAASDAELEHYRETYWSVVADYGLRADAPVFVDKQPMNTVLLPLIARLFPDAKILFALRDPRDVVLSAFRRRFGMNPHMYELTSLESAAAYYDSVMTLADIYRPLLELDLTETRHEDLVADFDGETRRLCAFLGLEWRAEMKNFAGRAQQGAVNTPSSAQVARGLSRDGLSQWRHYEAQMAPVLPKLAPWVARHGYGDTV